MKIKYLKQAKQKKQRSKKAEKQRNRKRTKAKQQKGKEAGKAEKQRSRNPEIIPKPDQKRIPKIISPPWENHQYFKRISHQDMFDCERVVNGR
jgi:hypothetical protein